MARLAIADAFVGPDALIEGAAHPERAFVEVGQELRADDAAEGEIDGENEGDHADAHVKKRV